MEAASRVEKIAQEILAQARAGIVVSMRFLDMAVFRLKPLPDPKKFSLATDGDLLYYNPVWLLRRYRQEESALFRDYLHVLLHCIFRHPFVNALAVDHALWDLACDIAVEALICEFGLTRFHTSSELARQAVVDGLRKQVKSMTAERLYNYFQDHAPDGSWAGLFHADDHDIWYAAPRQRQTSTRQNDDNGQTSPPPQSSPQADDRSRLDDGSDKPQSAQPDDIPQPERAQQPSSSTLPDFSAWQRLKDEWTDIGEHMQMNLETFAKRQGLRAGGLAQQLAELNRERYDYEAFLRKFAMRGEVMQIDSDSFDYIFYTYGLRLYGNMPLIEPLEYREVKRIREFVIAIDTSGSTSGELVRSFLTKTYNILLSTESFFSKVNIYIIQCDAEIQDVVKISSADQLADYAKHATVHGMGGTDFRPVFRYVNELIHRGEFKRLKGLIYFTDGCGTFPEKKPDYTTAFVFVQDAYNNLDVPPWAIKLILEKDEI